MLLPAQDYEEHINTVAVDDDGHLYWGQENFLGTNATYAARTLSFTADAQPRWDDVLQPAFAQHVVVTSTGELATACADGTDLWQAIIRFFSLAGDELVNVYFADFRPTGITAAANGDVLVAGFDETWMSKVMRIAPDGTLLWLHELPQLGVVAADVALDAAGDVYVSGAVELPLGPWKLAKLAADGTMLVAPVDGCSDQIAVAPDGTVTAMAGLRGQGDLVPDGEPNLHLCQFDADLNLLWQREESRGGTDNIRTSDVVLDSHGHMIATGFHSVTPAGVVPKRTEMWTRMYDSGGELLWEDRYGAEEGPLRHFGVALGLNADDSVVVAGYGEAGGEAFHILRKLVP